MSRLPSSLRRTLLLASCALGSLALLYGGGCKSKSANDAKIDADAKSGFDGKRSGARELLPNVPITDEVNYANQDRTDWYRVLLRGHSGVLNTVIHWDNDSSDVMIDVFDEFGKQISASPVRSKMAKEKILLTQIDRAGLYYLRVSAPGKTDGSVYTMEAKWDAPPEPKPVQPVASEPPPHHRPPKEAHEPREKPTGETVQGRIVSAYREGSGLTLQLDKGSAAGLKPGMSGSVLLGPAGEEVLAGGEFRVLQVLEANKSVAHTALHSVGHNTRVVISLSR